MGKGVVAYGPPTYVHYMNGVVAYGPPIHVHCMNGVVAYRLPTTTMCCGYPCSNKVTPCVR
jgi:hypothetical protein